ncbi:MAG: chemotaxis protein CheW [Actinomycetota bacterium]
MGSTLHGLVMFRTAAAAFALPVEDVREVVPVARLSAPPQMSSVVEGILNLAGVAVPVLRLDRLLGLSDARFGLDASILIMRGEPTFGLLVEHVDGVRDASTFAIMAVAEGASFNGCLVAELEHGGLRAHLLSWARLLLAEERVRMAEFQAQAQARLAEAAEAP